MDVVRLHSWPPALLLLTAVLASGCGSTQDADVERSAEAFAAALQREDGRVACGLLAPRTRSELEKSAARPCAEAILEEDLPDPGARRKVSAYGTMAQVRYSQESVFLTRFDGSWRVMAAGCSPSPSGPYDCQVQGG